MRLTRLDFVAAPAGSSRAGVLLVAFGVMLAGAAVFDDAAGSDELARLQHQRERAQAAYQRAKVAHAAASNRRAGLFGTDAVAVERRLNLPWGALLDALERAQSDNVALLGIEPDAARGRLRVSGEARDMNALVDYIGALEGKGGIADLRVLSQQVKETDAQHPVEFQLEARWGVAAPAATEQRL